MIHVSSNYILEIVQEIIQSVGSNPILETYGVFLDMSNIFEKLLHLSLINELIFYLKINKAFHSFLFLNNIVFFI